jgi:hypothetical protein
MRNDARPIGEGAKSPLEGHHDDPITNDQEELIAQEEPIVNCRGVNRAAVEEDATMPADDSTLNTKI